MMSVSNETNIYIYIITLFSIILSFLLPFFFYYLAVLFTLSSPQTSFFFCFFSHPTSFLQKTFRFSHVFFHSLFIFLFIFFFISHLFFSNVLHQAKLVAYLLATLAAQCNTERVNFILRTRQSSANPLQAG